MIIAPQDLKAGGTWIGYNEHGLLVAVTNRWTDTSLTGDRSRGLLVRDALRRESAEDAARFVESEIERHQYEGFNLVTVNSKAALLLEWDGRLHVMNFDPGIHIIANVGTDDHITIPETMSRVGRDQAESIQRAWEILQPAPEESVDRWLDRAVCILRDHGYGFCIHEDTYGTRSSSLIQLRSDGDIIYRFASGPPCQTEYDVVQ